MVNLLKNVIIINDSNYICGGEDKVAITTANLLVEKYDNINVYFFSNNNIDNSPLDKRVINVRNDMNIPLENKNKIKGIIQGYYNRNNKVKLKQFLKQFNNNNSIICVHSWSKCISSCIFDVAYSLNLKCVLTLHDYFTSCPNGGFYNYKRCTICKKTPLSLRCIFTNCDSRNYAFKIFRVIRQFRYNKSLKKLKYAITISNFSENIHRKYFLKNIVYKYIRNPFTFDDNEKRMNPSLNSAYLFVGRISKEKGIEDFCKAITSTNFYGIVVGDGPERKKLEVKYPSIKFVGWKKYDEIKRIMRSSRALVFPSKWYECSPLTIIEAMSQGLPCISSSCNAAVDDLIFENGIIYSSFEELKSALKKSSNDELIEKLSVNSYNYVKKIYFKNKYIIELMDFLQKILND